MRLSHLTVLGVLAAACSPTPATPASATPEPLSAAALDSVRAVDAAFAAAMNAKDSAAVMAIYASDAMLMPPDSPALEGDGIGATLAGLIAGRARATWRSTRRTPTASVTWPTPVGTATFTMGGSTRDGEVHRGAAARRRRPVALRGRHVQRDRPAGHAGVISGRSHPAVWRSHDRVSDRNPRHHHPRVAGRRGSCPGAVGPAGRHPGPRRADARLGQPGRGAPERGADPCELHRLADRGRGAHRPEHGAVLPERPADRRTLVPVAQRALEVPLGPASRRQVGGLLPRRFRRLRLADHPGASQLGTVRLRCRDLHQQQVPLPSR